MPGNYPHYYYVSVGLIVGVAGRAGKSFTQVNVHHGRTFCTLGPSTSLPYFHKCMSYLCIISYAMNSYHQFQELIKQVWVQKRLTVGSVVQIMWFEMTLYVLLMLCYTTSVSTLYPIMVVQ